MKTSTELHDAPPEVVRLLVDRWMAAVDSTTSRRHGFALRWQAVSSARRAPEAANAEPVRWRASAAGGSLANRGGRIRWTAGSREAKIELRAGCRHQPLLLEPLVEAALGLALSRQGACFVHAAAVRIAATNLLVMGASGAGKSTLAAAVLSAGGSVVSDDSLILSSRGGRPLVRAARRDLWLRAGAERLVQALRRRGVSLRRTRDGRRRLNRSDSPQLFQPHFEPERLIVLRRDLRLARARVERWSQAEALAALVKGTSALYFTDRRFGRQQAPVFGLLARFAESLPTSELRVGRWLLEEPARCLEAVVEALAS